MTSSIPLKISLRSILNFWHSVDWERTGRWPIFNNDQFTLLYEFDTLQIIYSTKWHLYWVRYKILNNIKLSPSQLCLSRISVLGIDTPYSIYVELINYFGEVVALTIRSQFFIPTVHFHKEHLSPPSQNTSDRYDFVFFHKRRSYGRKSWRSAKGLQLLTFWLLMLRA